MDTMKLRRWWSRRGLMILRVGTAVMALVAGLWLGYEFWRLLFQPADDFGAVDLRNRHLEFRQWFSEVKPDAPPYPPASYLLLWPFFGWLDLSPARWLWGLTTLVMLGWMCRILPRESGAETPDERAFVGMMFLSTYATGATIGNGQLNIHVLAFLLAGICLLRDREKGWPRDLAAAGFILIALIKPTVTAPFFWILMCRRGSKRTAVLVVVVYAALSFIWGLITGGAVGVVADWPEQGVAGATVSAPLGAANLHTWLASLGLGYLTVPASLIALGLMGFWTSRHRNVDTWLLLAVTAIFARFWVYHRWYDDLLMILPMIALFRIAKHGPVERGRDLIAGVLLALLVLAMLAPGGLYFFPPPLNQIYLTGEVTLWIIVWIFLIAQAWREKRQKCVA